MELPFEMRLRLSKRFPPGVSEAKFGPYSLVAIPSNVDSAGEAVLKFTSRFESESGGSHPEEEAANAYRVLSLVADVKVGQEGVRVNGIDIPPSQAQSIYPQFLGQLDVSTLETDLAQINSLPQDLCQQFLRSCHTYSFALNFVPSDITFAFFLLVVAVECLSSQESVIPSSELHLDQKKCERFCLFIKKYFPTEGRNEDERKDDLFTEMLKTVYYSHRSGFVHGGKEVSTASLMADKAKSSYFKHRVEGKDIRTPGLGWFAKVVRGALLGFLRGRSSAQPDDQLLAKIAYEKAGLEMKFRRDVVKGQVLTLDDVEYR